MSVQFGRWNFDGKPVDRDYLEKVKPAIAPYGPDGGSSYFKDNVSILYHSFHTTKESRRELQPHVTASGMAITWDGRLDNRAELIRQLGDVVTSNSPDVSIVAAAYERWETDCFAKLIGDWALSIWNPSTGSLVLAKDPIGSRHLYYSLDNTQVTWSSVLDPLVLLAGETFALCEEYIAGWLSLFPPSHLTPYAGIHAVPPSSSVLLQTGKQTVRKYWDFDPGRQTHYRTDAEYEEHFRMLFRESVAQRLRADTPALAELSGGMDSSSIVCIADLLMGQGLAETPRLDTISYFNDSEPHWNERPYFMKVEEKRGRHGRHIDVGQQQPFQFDGKTDGFSATPGISNGQSESARQFTDCLRTQGNRVLLSGIGGDEVLGGVPDPTPALCDLLAKARLGQLLHHAMVWAQAKRKPVLYLLSDTVKAFLPRTLAGLKNHKGAIPWLRPEFARRNWHALWAYQPRKRFFGPLPSFQDNLTTLEALRSQFATFTIAPDPPYEKRYPFLDRNLLEFLYSVPQEQILRPHHRRSLMRRALAEIVPDEILNRKQKAFVSKTPLAAITSQWASLSEISRDMVSESLGIIDGDAFRATLQRVRHGQEAAVLPLIRSILIEMWLKTLADSDLFDLSGSSARNGVPGIVGRKASLSSA